MILVCVYEQHGSPRTTHLYTQFLQTMSFWFWAHTHLTCKCVHAWLNGAIMSSKHVHFHFQIDLYIYLWSMACCKFTYSEWQIGLLRIRFECVTMLRVECTSSHIRTSLRAHPRQPPGRNNSLLPPRRCTIRRHSFQLDDIANDDGDDT